MKTRIASLAIALGLFVLACDSATNSPAPAAPQVKPLDTLQVAKDFPVTLEAGKTVRLVFVPTPDATYQIKTLGSTDTYLELRDSSGSRSLAIDENLSGANGTITYTATSASPLILQIAGQTAATVGATLVSVTMTNGPDAFESDNTLSTAKALAVDGIAQSRTFGKGDTDWVKIPVEAGKSYQVSAQDSGTVRIRLFAADSSFLTPEVDSSVSFHAPKSGFVYARLHLASPKSMGSYALRAELATALVDAYEFDNTLSTAKAITTDSVLQSRALSLNDTDWVKIPVDSGMVYSVFGTGTYPVRIRLFAADSSSLTQESDSAVGFLSSRRGYVYARLQYASATPRRTGAYALGVTRKAAPAFTDAFEYDNTIATAKTISTDSTLQHRGMSLADTDWVKIAVDSGTLYKIAGSGSNTLYIQLYTADSTSLTNEIPSTVTYLATKSGFVYARLNYYFATSNYTGAYSVGVSVQSPASLLDSYESDNTLSTAKPITTDGVSQSHSLSVGDTDWVKIAVEAGMIYRLSGSGSNSLYFTLFDADSNALTSTSTYSLQYAPATSGVLYARLHFAAATASYIGDYKVNVTKSAPDSYESDNTLATAKVLPTTGSTQSRNLGLGDTDWVKIAADSGTTYTINAYGDHSVSIQYFDADSNALTSTSTYSVSYTATKAGTLYARLHFAQATSEYTGTYYAYASASVSDRYEPDSTRALATSLIPNAAGQIHELSPGEHDWLKVDLVAGTTYTLSMDDSPSGWTLVTDIYPSLTSTRIAKSLETSSGSSTTYTPTVTGTHYLDVHGYSTGSNGAYTLSITSP